MTRYPSRTWDFNQRFFHEVNSESTAYWSGFLLADGNISAGRYVRCQLAARDCDHLEKFKADLGLSQPLKFLESRAGESFHPAVGLTIGSRAMVQDLAELNVVPRKSGCEVAPLDQIPAGLQRHFWRGVVDGDGGIGSTTRRGTSSPGPTITLVGSKMLCGQFRDFVLDSVGKFDAAVRPHSSIYRMQIAKKAVAHRLLELLYDDATVYLDRKHELALAWGFTPAFVANPDHKAQFTFDQAQVIRARVAAGEGQRHVARELRVSPQTINEIVLWRKYVAPVGQRPGDFGKAVRA